MILNNYQSAIFIRRYKRFLVDVKLADGTIMTVHCPNTGSMRGCLVPGGEVLISKAVNLQRKYSHTLEMTKVAGHWIGINTMRTNPLVREAIEAGVIKELADFVEIRPEVKVSAHSRLDFLVIKHNIIKDNHEGFEDIAREDKIYLEVKNSTMVEDGLARFPDAVTARGTKHLEELMALGRQGYGAMILFCVQHTGALSFAPARAIDPLYSQTLERAAAQGVKVVAYKALVSPQEICLQQALPVRLG